jgi:hypothetical protein
MLGEQEFNTLQSFVNLVLKDRRTHARDVQSEHLQKFPKTQVTLLLFSMS